ncbi:phage protein [Streptococcus pneumoniae]|nr:phage protein [Streptococcus pneumoniae]CFQ03893.1 phage protein [Streptococcus pneumoniae]CFU99793.1 phage protein [Streptococcus pneumoniae]CIY95605.1 phage protein [Streptococcus pneumoniae]CMZ91836.1 phage protein [Streptococcus pneumoniae]
MTPEQVKETLEGVKWINKEIEGLYLELATLESGIIKKQEPKQYQSTNKQGKYGRE